MRPVTYRSGATVLEADTCDALAAAARRGDVELSALARGALSRAIRSAMRCRASAPSAAGTRAQDQRWGLDWHRNEGIELTLLARGRLAFATDAGRHLLRPRRPDDHASLAAPPRRRPARHARAACTG